MGSAVQHSRTLVDLHGASLLTPHALFVFMSYSGNKTNGFTTKKEYKYTSGTLNYASAGQVHVAGEKEEEKPTNPCGHTTATPRQQHTRQERNDLPTHNPIQQQ